jgi:hypothetical protein
VGQHLVVVDPPGLDLGARVIEVDEPVLVQALVPKLPVEGLDENVVDGLPGRMKWSSTPRRYAHASSAVVANSGPLSTTIAAAAAG